jgi:hypothetical protein
MQFIFLSSFPWLTKPKHWTRELQRQLAVKRGDRMLVNFPHGTESSCVYLKSAMQRGGNKAEEDKTEKEKAMMSSDVKWLLMISSQKERASIPLEDTRKMKIYDARCHDRIYCCALARCFF